MSKEVNDLLTGQSSAAIKLSLQEYFERTPQDELNREFVALEKVNQNE